MPTDFSECASYALSYATSFARIHKAKLICLHVIEPIVPAIGYTGIADPLSLNEVSEQLEESATRELPKIANCPECSDIEVEEIITHGDAAAEVVKTAKERDVDLIVIASHGRTGIERIFFGSTAESVVRHAHCPVLVVKSNE